MNEFYGNGLLGKMISSICALQGLLRSTCVVDFVYEKMANLVLNS